MEDRQTLAVKGMVCNRCITVLRTALEKQQFKVLQISLGQVTLGGLGAGKSLEKLEEILAPLHFELIQDRDTRIIQQIKSLVEEALARQQYAESRVKFSQLLSEALSINYDALSAIFSRTEGITLESYIIGRRIDKIKEFLVYTDHSLTEIAYLTGYSSVFHLSRQFKAQTSLTPSHFRQLKKEKDAMKPELNHINLTRKSVKNTASTFRHFVS
ncbi:MAG TPA: AraC family transcriptional regulator [Sphingobacteriaceae bacterium]